MRNGNRERNNEALRIFSYEELDRIRQLAHNWYVDMASRDGSLDEEFRFEAIAEAVYRYLASQGRIKQ